MEKLRLETKDNAAGGVETRVNSHLCFPPGADALYSDVAAPVVKEYGLHNGGRDNHNGIKGGSGHLSGLAERSQGPQSTTLARGLTWQELKPVQNSPRPNEWWAKCEDLARQPNILDRFVEVFRRSVVGEACRAMLLYLALTSRVLAHPVSVSIKGPSSAGKSFLVQQVLQFFPPSAYCVLTAMSEKALAYWDEPLKHRFLVIMEATGSEGESASYFLRSLLSEGRIRYLTVEKTIDELKPRLIEREGPTGLITTTTEISLHPENETRYFSVDVDDTPDQTRQVLKATARKHQ